MITRQSVLSFFAISAAFLSGYVPTFVSPWVIGALVSELGLSASESGILLSLEFAGIALAGWIAVPFLGRFSPRTLALVGAIVAFTAHTASMLTVNVDTIAAFRLLAGFGAGVALSVSSAAVSQQANPDRIYGLLLFIMAIGSAATQFMAGQVSVLYGYRGLFGMLAVYIFIAIPFIAMLPVTMEKAQTKTGNIDTGSVVPGVAIIIAVICFTVTQMGAWTFLERLGDSIKIDLNTMSNIFGIGQIIGLSGGGAAAWLNIRYGRTTPLTIGLMINAFAILVLYAQPNHTSYMITFFMFNTMWYFCLPYFLGTAVLLDNTGKWAAAAASASLFGIAFGPAGFGRIYDAFGLSGIGWSALAISLLSLIIMLLVIHRLQKIQLHPSTNSVNPCSRKNVINGSNSFS